MSKSLKVQVIRKMRPCIEQSNDLEPLSPFRSWLDCTTNTSGYDFRKGQERGIGVAAERRCAATRHAKKGGGRGGGKRERKERGELAIC